MSVLVPTVDLRPDHWDIVRNALRRHVPDREVVAFGSRATWTAKDYSDLDLAIMGEEPLPLRTASALSEALGDSDLPFRVDIVDWARIDDSFREIILRDGVSVQTRLATTDTAAATPHSSTILTRMAGASERRGSGDRGGVGDRSMHRLGDIVNLNWGDTKTTKKSYTSVGFPAYSAAGQDGFLPYHDHSRTGVVLSAIGANCGKTWLAKGKWSCIKNTIRFWSTSPEADTEYLYWLTRNRDFWPKRGSAQTFISQGDARAIRVALPGIGEQRAIAHILGTLDDKIELNRRMNETLEAMARALFKSWFVDFDPVRAKMEGRDTGLPRDIADLYPTRLVDSEMGEIPEGWKVVALDGLARFQNGLALQKFRPVDNEARLPVVKIAQMRAGEANSGEWASAAIRRECIIDDGDVLFSWSGSLLVTTWAGGRAALNQHLFKVTSERYPKWFYLHSLLSHLPAFRQIARDKATTMGHIRRHHLTEALCVTPPDGVIAQLSDTFSCLLELQVATELSSRTLASLRDTLLPKLTSGEIRVPYAERVVESAT